MINPMTNHPSFARQLTMRDVEIVCDKSDAVESYDDAAGGAICIVWCDGTIEEFNNPNQAINAIAAMEAN